jgi:hypothetical protein
MSVTVEALADLPVILITYFDTITLNDLETALTLSTELTAQGHPTAYRILHNADAETNFADVLQLARQSLVKFPASEQSNYQLILVGHDRWTKLYVDIMSQKQFGGRAIPCFGVLDQALAYVRSQEAEKQS